MAFNQIYGQVEKDSIATESKFISYYLISDSQCAWLILIPQTPYNSKKYSAISFLTGLSIFILWLWSSIHFVGSVVMADACVDPEYVTDQAIERIGDVQAREMAQVQ